MQFFIIIFAINAASTQTKGGSLEQFFNASELGSCFLLIKFCILDEVFFNLFTRLCFFCLINITNHHHQILDYEIHLLQISLNKLSCIYTLKFYLCLQRIAAAPLCQGQVGLHCHLLLCRKFSESKNSFIHQ